METIPNNDNIFDVYAVVKVGPWRALQMREVPRSEYDERLLASYRLLEESYNHTDDCGWWNDWDDCDCNPTNAQP